MKIYWAPYHFGPWQLLLAATNQGLCTVSLPNDSFESMVSWLITHIPGAELSYTTNDSEILRPYSDQLTDYFSGTRRAFDLPLDLRGTPFQMDVWHALITIPFGETRSYADIAEAIHRPKAVRAVGTANGANPLPIIVPCHRVIGKNGTLTGYRGGTDIKAALLQLEGLTVTDKIQHPATGQTCIRPL